MSPAKKLINKHGSQNNFHDGKYEKKQQETLDRRGSDGQKEKRKEKNKEKETEKSKSGF